MRKYEGRGAKIVTGITAVAAMNHILYISGLFNLIGFDIFLLQFRAGSLALVLLLVYLLYPFGRKASQNKLDWHDVIFMAMGVVPCVFMFFYSSELIIWHTKSYYTPALIAFIPLLISIIESVRRSSGKPIVIIGIIFFLYPLFQNYIPGVFGGKALPFAPYCSNLLKGTEYSILGTAFGAACSVIVIYCILGEFMSISGASDFFLDLAKCGLGKVRGGPAKVGVISASLFGMISGSVTAGVASTGSICIPMMTKSGYKDYFAGAVEAVACNGGQIMPPVMGLVVFVMADLTGISYGKIIVASIIPAALYYLALFIQVDMAAVKDGLKGLPATEIPAFRAIIKKGWKHIIPLLCLVILLMVLDYSPERAGLFAILVLLAVDFASSPKRERITLRKIIEALDRGMRIFLSPGIMTALIGIIMGAVMQTGIGVKLSSIFIEIAGGNLLVLLLLTAVATYILGMGLGSIPLYIMMVVLTAPALLDMGVGTLQAHLFVLWYGLTSFITPPVAIAIYVSIAISHSGLWKTGWEAMKLGMGTYIVPFLFVYKSGLLLEGSPASIVLAVITSLLSIAAVSYGASGYFLKRMSIVETVLWVAGGFLSFVTGILMYIGFGTLLAGIALHLISYRHDRRKLSAGTQP